MRATLRSGRAYHLALVLWALTGAGCADLHELRTKEATFADLPEREAAEAARTVARAAERCVTIRPAFRVIGSGCVLTHDGWILTAEHVVRNREVVDVDLWDGASYEGRVVASSERNDFALVKIEAQSLKAFRVGPRPGLGQRVFAVGTSTKYEEPNASTGLVLYPRVRIPGEDGTYYYDAIWHMAPIFPGDSGGPLVDKDGRLVGIHGGFASESASIAIAAEECLRALPPEAVRDDGPGPRAVIGEVLARDPAFARALAGGPPAHLAARFPRDFAESSQWTVGSVEETLVDVYGLGETAPERRVPPEVVRQIIVDTRARFVEARRRDARPDAALVRAMLAEIFRRIEVSKGGAGP